MLGISPVTPYRAPVAFRGNSGAAKPEEGDRKTYAERVDDTLSNVDRTAKAATDAATKATGAVVTTSGAITGSIAAVKKTVGETLDDDTKGFFKKVAEWFKVKDAQGVVTKKVDPKKLGTVGVIVAAIVAAIMIHKNVKKTKAAKEAEAKTNAAKEAEAKTNAAKEAEAKATAAESKAKAKPKEVESKAKVEPDEIEEDE